MAVLLAELAPAVASQAGPERTTTRVAMSAPIYLGDELGAAGYLAA